MIDTNCSAITPPATPRWCINGHIETIGRSVLSHPPEPPANRLKIPTPDDDFLEVDVLEADECQAVAVLFHGLEGSSQRYYMLELVRALHEAHFSVAAVNFRGCGALLNRQPRFYHSGDSAELETVFRWAGDYFNGTPMAAVGFSLGGNVLLKYLGERGTESPLRAAAAVSVPYNLKAGSRVMNRGFNKIYELRFLRTLRQKLAAKRRRFPELPAFPGWSLYQFDNAVTAPLHGFCSADDYYAQSSAGSFVPAIKTPTLIVHSQQDPICRFDTVPVAAIKQNNSLQYIFTESGGHVGFWDQDKAWLNRTIVNYLSPFFD